MTETEGTAKIEETPNTLEDILKDPKYCAAQPNFQRKYCNFIDARISVYDLFIILLSLLTILLSVVAVIFVLSANEYTLHVARALCWLMSVTSTLTVCIIGALYHCTFTRYQYCNLPKASFWDYITSEKRFIKFFAEVVIHLVFPYPGLEDNAYWLSLLSFLRIYRVWPLLLQLSDVYQMRHRINVYMTFFNQSIPDYSSGLIFRILLNTKSFQTFGVITIAVYLTLCYLTYAAMRATDNSTFDFATSLYWSMQTSATLGYGEVALDHSKAYELFISITVAFVGLIINSLLTGIFAMKLSTSEIEERAIEIGNGIQLIEELKLLSAKIIQLRYLIYLAEKKRKTLTVDYEGDEEFNKLVISKREQLTKECDKANFHLQDTMQQIASIRWELNDTFPKFLGLGVSEDINGLQDKWDKRIDEYKEMVKKICIIFTNLNLLCHTFNMETRGAPALSGCD